MHSHEVITRRNLPHIYMPGACHFVTYRLAGTIPQGMLVEWRRERDRLLARTADLVTGSAAAQRKAHESFFGSYDGWLDSHRDLSWLAEPRVAAMVRQNLYHHHGSKYHLLSYCVMPNHVHALLQILAELDDAHEPSATADENPDSRGPLSKTAHSLKSSHPSGIAHVPAAGAGQARPRSRDYGCNQATNDDREARTPAKCLCRCVSCHDWHTSPPEGC